MNVKEVYQQVIDNLKENKLDQITEKEFDSNFKFFPSSLKSELELKLDKNGFLKRTSHTPILCKDIKLQFDAHCLKSLLESGKWTYTPSNPKLLESIQNASSDVHGDNRLIVVCEKTKDEFLPTINNSNSSHKARSKKVKENIKKI